MSTADTLRRVLPIRRLVFLALLALLAYMLWSVGRPLFLYVSMTWRTTPVYDPPVLAGQGMAACSAGVYARTAEGAIVVTTTGHCFHEGDIARTLDGRVIGTASGPTRWATCDKPGKDRCTASDMAYITLVPGMIPWGRLDQVDMGAGGYTTIAKGTRALTCADVKEGDPVDFDGRGLHRSGSVIGQEANDFEGDGTYFPCITVTTISAGGGDSGGVILVRGVPAGVASRVYGPDQNMGFTPLADGLAELGLTMCDDPNCGLTPETAANR